jgi:hypothetical protein
VYLHRLPKHKAPSHNSSNTITGPNGKQVMSQEGGPLPDGQVTESRLRTRQAMVLVLSGKVPCLVSPNKPYIGPQVNPAANDNAIFSGQSLLTAISKLISVPLSLQERAILSISKYITYPQFDNLDLMC